MQLLNKTQNDCFCSDGRFCNFSRDEKLRQNNSRKNIRQQVKGKLWLSRKKVWIILYLYDYFLSGISYSEVNFTLNQLSCIPFAVVLSCSFGGQKNEKPRHRVHQSHDALLMNCRAISFSHISSAEAHSFGNINVPSSQTLLARNGATSILTRIQPGRDNSLFAKKHHHVYAPLKQFLSLSAV